MRLKIETESVRLINGDYLLKDWPHLGVVEKKGAMTELFSNLFTKDKVRAHKAFKRLSDAAKHPYLLIEGSPAEMARSITGMKMGKIKIDDPGFIWDRLWEVLHKYNFSLVWCGGTNCAGSRRIIGELMLRAMLRDVVNDCLVSGFGTPLKSTLKNSSVKLNPASMESVQSGDGKHEKVDRKRLTKKAKANGPKR